MCIRDSLKIKRRLNEILLKHTGKDLDTLENDTDRDNYMSAEEAVQYGMVDRVLERLETTKSD